MASDNQAVNDQVDNDNCAAEKYLDVPRQPRRIQYRHDHLFNKTARVPDPTAFLTQQIL